MKKTTISISELAHRVLMEQKLNKWVSEMHVEWRRIQEITRKVKKSLNEGGGMQALAQASQELEDAGKDASDETVQSALLIAALKNGGDFTKVDPQDVEAEMQTAVKEFAQLGSKRQLNELEGSLAVLKDVSTFLGNAALVEAVCKGLSEATGKDIDASKFKSAASKVTGFLAKIGGLAGKAIKLFIGWVAKLLGASESQAKMAGMVGLGLITFALLVFAVINFPLAGKSIPGIALSVTSVVGKLFELNHLRKKIKAELAKVPGGVEGGAEPAVA